MNAPGNRSGNLLARGVTLAIALGLWFAPVPEGLTPKAWHLFAIFGSAILSFAGLSIRAQRIPEFAAQFEMAARMRLSAEDLIPETEVDAELDLAELNGVTMQDIRRLEPYGQGNPEPIFLSRQAQVMAARIVGGNPLLGKPGHLKLLLRSPQGGRPVDVIGFGMATAPVVQGGRIDFLYTPEINTWNGNASLQLRLKDFKYLSNFPVLSRC